MQRGSILRWPNFRFHDGEASDKYVIVMNSEAKESLVLVTVTSKQHKRSTLPNCQIEPLTFFFPAGTVAAFSLDTWVVLDSQPYAAKKDEVQKRIDSGEVEEVEVLEEKVVNAIRNCLVSNSRMLSQKLKKLLRKPSVKK